MSSQGSPGRTRKMASAPITDRSLTVDEFCAAEHMSRAMLYRAWAEGWGPDFYRIGIRRRITQRARLKWQGEREAASRCENNDLSPTPESAAVRPALRTNTGAGTPPAGS